MLPNTRPQPWNQRPPPPARPSSETWGGGRPHPAFEPLLFRVKEAVPPANHEETDSNLLPRQPSFQGGQTEKPLSSEGVLNPEAVWHRVRRHSQKPTHTFPCACSFPSRRAWETGGHPGPAAGAAAAFVMAPGREKGPFVSRSSPPGCLSSPISAPCEVQGERRAAWQLFSWLRKPALRLGWARGLGHWSLAEDLQRGAKRDGKCQTSPHGDQGLWARKNLTASRLPAGMRNAAQRESHSFVPGVLPPGARSEPSGHAARGHLFAGVPASALPVPGSSEQR